jgi:hypothetical protein
VLRYLRNKTVAGSIERRLVDGLDGVGVSRIRHGLPHFSKLTDGTAFETLFLRLTSEGAVALTGLSV